jgi:hypothetical protein
VNPALPIPSAHNISSFPARLKATALHLACSAFLISAIAALVFGLWYPGPYRELAGGGRLFWLIAGVDLVMGPLLTLVVFNTQKKRAELARDVGLIAVLQVLALAYGVWTMAAARPVHQVFEVDLFRVVTANAVATQELQRAPQALRRLPLTGPTVIGVVKPTDPKALFEAMMLGAQGTHLASLPPYWVPYEQLRGEALRRSKSLDVLKPRNAAETQALAQAVQATGLPVQRLRWLPLVSARASWVALLDEQGQVVGQAAVDAP